MLEPSPTWPNFTFGQLIMWMGGKYCPDMTSYGLDKFSFVTKKSCGNLKKSAGLKITAADGPFEKKVQNRDKKCN